MTWCAICAGNARCVVATLLTTVIVGMTVTIINLRTDVAIIQGNRFSSSDALRMRRDIEQNMPSADVLRRLMEHERRLDRIEGRNP